MRTQHTSRSMTIKAVLLSRRPSAKLTSISNGFSVLGALSRGPITAVPLAAYVLLLLHSLFSSFLAYSVFVGNPSTRIIISNPLHQRHPQHPRQTRRHLDPQHPRQTRRHLDPLRNRVRQAHTRANSRSRRPRSPEGYHTARNTASHLAGHLRSSDVMLRRLTSGTGKYVFGAKGGPRLLFGVEVGVCNLLWNFTHS